MKSRKKQKNEIKKGCNLNYVIKITDIQDIAVRDLPPDEKIDKHRLDIRRIMERKRFRKEGVYITDEQWPKFYKLMTMYNKIFEDRQK